MTRKCKCWLFLQYLLSVMSSCTLNTIVPYVWPPLSISVRLCSRQQDWNLGVLQELFSNTLQQKLFYTITSRGGHNNHASMVLEANANLREFFVSRAGDEQPHH